MKHSRIITAGIGLLLTVILIALVRLVDVAPIGADGTSIGLSHLNQFVFDLFGVNMLWYNITDWLGVAAVLTGFVFAVTGLVQLIKRRSLLKVDREILALGGLYIVVIGLYLFFENVIVNYRPIIMPDNTRPEASFPSSHTMLVCVIMGSAAMLINRYIIKQTAEPDSSGGLLCHHRRDGRWQIDRGRSLVHGHTRRNIDKRHLAVAL